MNVMRAENEEGALPRALVFLWHNIRAHARFAARHARNKRDPLARISFTRVVVFSAAMVVPVTPAAEPHGDYLKLPQNR
jgi:hypothetical protein